MDELEVTGRRPRTNPDGDVRQPVDHLESLNPLTHSRQVVLEGVSYDDFVIPDCPDCLNEGRTNRIVCRMLSSTLYRPNSKLVAQTRGNILRRVDQSSYQGSIVRVPPCSRCHSTALHSWFRTLLPGFKISRNVIDYLLLVQR